MKAIFYWLSRPSFPFPPPSSSALFIPSFYGWYFVTFSRFSTYYWPAYTACREKEGGGSVDLEDVVLTALWLHGQSGEGRIGWIRWPRLSWSLSSVKREHFGCHWQAPVTTWIETSSPSLPLLSSPFEHSLEHTTYVIAAVLEDPKGY